MTDTSETPEQDSTCEPEASPGPPATKRSRFRRYARRRWLLLASAGLLVLAIVVVWIVDQFWVSAGPDQGQVPEIVDGGPLLDAQLEAVNAGNSETIFLDEAVLSDLQLQPLAGNEAVEVLRLDGGKITDRGIETIASLPNLRELRLRHSPISDAGLEQLARCQSLQTLNLPHARCTSAGIAHLQSLERLRNLRLGSSLARPSITNAIAELSTLRSVHLIDIPVSDQGVKQLAAMPLLESLYLDGSAVTDVGWRWVFRMHPELHVHIDQAHHDHDPHRHPHH
ncbi:leucine-rich repeat domain-containing protein [Roseimaritima sediminicola]|uniref:leucine-rich repeat domain-containing protein n=1 Tax=Roseimaritima sediminicola TaxID=2662066 RepID=UPI00129854A4|nr:hypothetical protein [Roseimaritima sediminicola]